MGTVKGPWRPLVSGCHVIYSVGIHLCLFNLDNSAPAFTNAQRPLLLPQTKSGLEYPQLRLYFALMLVLNLASRAEALPQAAVDFKDPMPIEWLHIPNTGSSFGNTLLR